MLVDSNGYGWWSDFWNGVKSFFENSWDVILGTVISGVLIAVGLAMTILSSGTLGKLGATFISAGVSSFLGGIQSKLSGGSYWAGYVGGLVSGTIAGLGAFLGSVLGFGILAGIGGMAGNFVGTALTDHMNGKNILSKEYLLNLAAESVLSGLLAGWSFKYGNIISGLNIPGFRGEFSALAVNTEFVFSFLFDGAKSLLNGLTRKIRSRIRYA